MSDCNIIPFKDPAEKLEDALTILLREGARDLLGKAIEDKVQSFLSHYEGQIPLHLISTKGYPKSQ